MVVDEVQRISSQALPSISLLCPCRLNRRELYSRRLIMAGHSRSIVKPTPLPTGNQVSVLSHPRASSVIGVAGLRCSAASLGCCHSAYSRLCFSSFPALSGCAVHTFQHEYSILFLGHLISIFNTLESGDAKPDLNL